jgi:hypothetical protein
MLDGPVGHQDDIVSADHDILVDFHVDVETLLTVYNANGMMQW